MKFTDLRIKWGRGDPAGRRSDTGPTPKDAVGKDPESRSISRRVAHLREFLGDVKNQDARIADNPRAPDFARARFKRQPGKCTVECAVVSTNDRSSLSVIVLPGSDRSAGFRQCFLGELSVGRHFDLNMIRLELEDGVFTLGGPGVNGKTRP